MDLNAAEGLREGPQRFSVLVHEGEEGQGRVWRAVETGRGGVSGSVADQVENDTWAGGS